MDEQTPATLEALLAREWCVQGPCVGGTWPFFAIVAHEDHKEGACLGAEVAVVAYGDEAGEEDFARGLAQRIVDEHNAARGGR